MATTAPGYSSLPRMWTSISHNLKRHNKDTWKVNAKAYVPPNNVFTPRYYEQHYHNNMTYKSRPTTLETHCTPTRLVSFHRSPAGVSSTKWFSTRSTATPSGLNPPKTKPRVSSSWQDPEPFYAWRPAAKTPRHQVLNNEISTAYKNAITTSGMTYQLVPPDDNQCNIVLKSTSGGKITSLNYDTNN
jgi:hypothetical protein